MKSTARDMTDQADQHLERLLADIAAEHLFIETLATRDSDRMDFHDVHVANVKSALRAAYQAGMASRK